MKYLRGYRREHGQTLIIAMIILGLLLILGFVFLGIVDRNIRGSATAQTRSQTNDLAEAGIRYAHAELVDSPLGADWRGMPYSFPANTTLDPDAYYLRPATYLLWPGSNPPREDLGGPDGLGPYIRVNFNLGRALVRVRYAPSDANVFSRSPTGPLRNPGSVHSYLQIEAIGRSGVIRTNDPTTLASGNPVQIKGFTTTAQLQAAIAQLQQFDSQYVNSRHLLAFDTTGIIDYARFITNKYNVTRAADVGNPNPYIAGSPVLPGVGVTYSPNGAGNDLDIGSEVPYQLGTAGNIQSAATPSVPASGGSFMSNADLTIHGNVNVFLNQFFGEKWLVNGNIVGDDNAALQITQVSYDQATNTWKSVTPAALTPALFDTRSSSFTTDGGYIIDGHGGTDSAGYSRGVGRLDPPSILHVDPQSQETRYLESTRESGINNNGVNSGEFGHGRGVYVSNAADTQIPTNEAGRVGAGGTESLIDDWLNPNNTDPTTGWKGPFYVPVGAYVNLLSDGFEITLDNGTWKKPDGTDPNPKPSKLKYRVGTYLGQTYIVDGIESPNTINTNLPDFSQGQPFNGILYFEGNVRVKGEIPTDVQLTLVSGGTIYIEGSIWKGARGNDITDTFANTNPFYSAYGSLLTRPSKSAIMLMAKDYVTVNPTMFLGPTPDQSLQVVNDQQNDTGYSPIRIGANGQDDGELTMDTVLLTDPSTGGNSNDPAVWLPYATNYVDSLSASNNPLKTQLLLTHTMDDGSGAATFMSMFVNYGTYGSVDQHEATYAFPGSPSTSAPWWTPNLVQTPLGYFIGFDNTASDYLYASNNPLYWGSLAPPPAAGGIIPSYAMYGLGRNLWQHYDKFESRGFNLVDPATSLYNNGQITSNDETGGNNNDPYVEYALYASGNNELQIHPNHIQNVASNDYLLARAALVPGNVRIEASIFAEEGSFFVIPGPWFEPNPNDTRDAFNAAVSGFITGGSTPAQAQYKADEQRLENYGAGPEVPFYGEPVDVKVEVIGSVSENMPPSLSVQTASIQKQGWIPVRLGALVDPTTFNPVGIPTSHIPAGDVPATTQVVPNFIVEYDPMLATGRIYGFNANNDDPSDWVRTDSFGRALAPMPRLPVSPVPTYFGEVQ